MLALPPDQSRRILRIAKLHAANAAIAILLGHPVESVAVLLANAIASTSYWSDPRDPSPERTTDIICVMVGAMYYANMAARVRKSWVGAALFMANPTACYVASHKRLMEGHMRASTDWWVALHWSVFLSVATTLFSWEQKMKKKHMRNERMIN